MLGHVHDKRHAQVLIVRLDRAATLTPRITLQADRAQAVRRQLVHVPELGAVAFFDHRQRDFIIRREHPTPLGDLCALPVLVTVGAIPLQ